MATLDEIRGTLPEPEPSGPASQGFMGGERRLPSAGLVGNAVAASVSDAGAPGLGDFLRLLFSGEYDRNPTRSGAVGASPLDRRGPLFGVPPAAAASPAIVPAAAAAPVGGARPVAPADLDMDLVKALEQRQRQQERIIPKPAPPILGARG